MSDRIIRASEIGQYDFCAKAWWLGSIEGVPQSNVRELQAGSRAHEEHGRQVRRAAQLQLTAIVLVGLGLRLAGVGYGLRRDAWNPLPSPGLSACHPAGPSAGQKTSS